MVATTSMISSVVGARSRIGKHRERTGAMSFDGWRVAITNWVVRWCLLEVLADRLGVVEHDRLVRPGHGRVGGRLRQYVVYHVAFRHAAFPGEKALEPGVRPDLFFRPTEEVRHVELDEVALGLGVCLPGERANRRRLSDARGSLNHQIHRLVDGSSEVIAGLSLTDLG
jgi:hypothetical protein